MFAWKNFFIIVLEKKNDTKKIKFNQNKMASERVILFSKLDCYGTMDSEGNINTFIIYRILQIQDLLVLWGIS